MKLVIFESVRSTVVVFVRFNYNFRSQVNTLCQANAFDSRSHNNHDGAGPGHLLCSMLTRSTLVLHFAHAYVNTVLQCRALQVPSGKCI